jgi:sugar-phosphatase
MRAVIFDMDGLLIDSEPLWKRAEQEVFATVGIHLDDEDCEQTLGYRTDMVVAHWYQRYPWSSPSQQSIADDIDARVAELVSLEGAAMPGAIRTIESAHGAGFAIGLATSSAVALIDAVVRTLQLGQYLAVACSGVDEELGKPDPAVYLTTARKLGIPPEECVAFEDTVVGIQAAKAAAMRAIAVPAPHNFDNPGFDIADLKLRSLEDFSIELIESL